MSDIGEQWCKASREKYWSEIDADEKIARLRKEVKCLQLLLSDVRDQVQRLGRHSHDQRGEIVIRLLDSGGPMMGSIGRHGDTDDIYF